MSYRVSVYFTRGITGWQGKLDEREVTYRADVRWLWLAKRLAASNLGNQGNLAYVIHDENDIVAEGPVTSV